MFADGGAKGSDADDEARAWEGGTRRTNGYRHLRRGKSRKGRRRGGSASGSRRHSSVVEQPTATSSRTFQAAFRTAWVLLSAAAVFLVARQLVSLRAAFAASERARPGGRGFRRQKQQQQQPEQEQYRQDGNASGRISPHLQQHQHQHQHAGSRRFPGELDRPTLGEVITKGEAAPSSHRQVGRCRSADVQPWPLKLHGAMYRFVVVVHT